MLSLYNAFILCLIVFAHLTITEMLLLLFFFKPVFTVRTGLSEQPPLCLLTFPLQSCLHLIPFTSRCTLPPCPYSFSDSPQFITSRSQSGDHRVPLSRPTYLFDFISLFLFLHITQLHSHPFLSFSHFLKKPQNTKLLQRKHKSRGEVCFF